MNRGNENLEGNGKRKWEKSNQGCDKMLSA